MEENDLIIHGDGTTDQILKIDESRDIPGLKLVRTSNSDKRDHIHDVSDTYWIDVDDLLELDEFEVRPQ